MDVAEFRAGRFFYQAFVDGNSTGWFFNAREGAFGPFDTRQQAQIELEAFIEKCIAGNVTGGRSPDTLGAEIKAETEEACLAPLTESEAASFGYFDKIRLAFRKRASQYMARLR